MSKLFSVLLGLTLFVPAMAPAALDETLRVKETIEINAAPSAVWAKLGNFGDMGAWHPAVAKTEITGGTNNQAGATRVLTLQDGGKINEVLIAHDDANMTMKYEITESVLPLREYGATLLVQPAGEGKSTVTWRSMFKRKDPANPAKAGEDDQTAKDVITSIFKSGLENLKKISEK
jgi:mxaD protein